MRERVKYIYYLAFIAIVFSLNTSAFAQVRDYRVSDRQVQALVNRIENKTNSFQRNIQNTFEKERRNGSFRDDQILTYVSNFEEATNTLKNNFSNRRSTAADVQQVLNRAVYINNAMRDNRINRGTQNQWNVIRNDLNTLANYYGVNWNWSNSPNTPVSARPYYVTDNQLKSLLVRIEQRADIFNRDLNNWLDRSRLNNTRREDNFNEYAKDFETATDRLRQNFEDRDSVAGDVEQVLRTGAVINRFVINNKLSSSLENQWRLLRGDLSTLANYYRISWNWNNPTYPNGTNDQNYGFDSLLTGTYRLNVNQSDNVSATIDRTIANVNYDTDQRDRTKRNLERRLASPIYLIIEKQGQQVSMASSVMSQVSFSADGVVRSETSNNGRTVQVKATSTNSDLTISYEGDRVNDYYVTFTPVSNDQLRVTRRIYLENRNETITVVSFYDKTDRNPRWDTANYSNTTNNSDIERFVIPNNTRIVATLDTPLSTKTIQDGDRFAMTVTSPSEYYGAVIEGFVAGEKSGVVSGRAILSLGFETIRMRNGGIYRFAGLVEQVRKPDGSDVSVDNEGTVRDSNRTTKTVVRTGVGAAIGAIIGAVVGGGKGAAIGAGIGAGAGAGTVILQGKDNLELSNGTEFTIMASAPGNVVRDR